MVAAGLLDTSTEHAQAVTNQAFGMREEAGKVIEPVNNQPIQVPWGHTRVRNLQCYVYLLSERIPIYVAILEIECFSH